MTVAVFKTSTTTHRPAGIRLQLQPLMHQLRDECVALRPTGSAFNKAARLPFCQWRSIPAAAPYFNICHAASCRSR